MSRAVDAAGLDHELELANNTARPVLSALVALPQVSRSTQSQVKVRSSTLDSLLINHSARPQLHVFPSQVGHSKSVSVLLSFLMLLRRHTYASLRLLSFRNNRDWSLRTLSLWLSLLSLPSTPSSRWPASNAVSSSWPTSQRAQ